MTASEAAALKRTSELAEDLKTVIDKLLSVRDDLPVSPGEAVMLLGEQDMDVATALRSTIECVVFDNLNPGFGELRKWAACQSPGEGA